MILIPFAIIVFSITVISHAIIIIIGYTIEIVGTSAIAVATGVVGGIAAGTATGAVVVAGGVMIDMDGIVEGDLVEGGAVGSGSVPSQKSQKIGGGGPSLPRALSR